MIYFKTLKGLRMLSPVTNDCEWRSQVEAISIKDTFLVCGIDFYTFSEDLQSLTVKMMKRYRRSGSFFFRNFAPFPSLNKYVLRILCDWFWHVGRCAGGGFSGKVISTATASVEAGRGRRQGQQLAGGYFSWSLKQGYTPPCLFPTAVKLKSNPT